jgi:hypothetical protein
MADPQAPADFTVAMNYVEELKVSYFNYSNVAA